MRKLLKPNLLLSNIAKHKLEALIIVRDDLLLMVESNSSYAGNHFCTDHDRSGTQFFRHSAQHKECFYQPQSFITQLGC